MKIEIDNHSKADTLQAVISFFLKNTLYIIFLIN